uniref:Uncharacterized protein n=1 Tax=Arundo donax TaxID=35708 RepID=A0A0A9CXN2_ARUDO
MMPLTASPPRQSCAPHASDFLECAVPSASFVTNAAACPRRSLTERLPAVDEYTSPAASDCPPTGNNGFACWCLVLAARWILRPLR